MFEWIRKLRARDVEKKETSETIPGKLGKFSGVSGGKLLCSWTDSAGERRAYLVARSDGLFGYFTAGLRHYEGFPGLPDPKPVWESNGPGTSIFDSEELAT